MDYFLIFRLVYDSRPMESAQVDYDELTEYIPGQEQDMSWYNM